VSNPILTEIIDDHRNPAAPLQHPMKSARRGGLAALSYTTYPDTTQFIMTENKFMRKFGPKNGGIALGLC
jgi:hypothetical protein